MYLWTDFRNSNGICSGLIEMEKRSNGKKGANGKKVKWKKRYKALEPVILTATNSYNTNNLDKNNSCICNFWRKGPTEKSPTKKRSNGKRSNGKSPPEKKSQRYEM